MPQISRMHTAPPYTTSLLQLPPPPPIIQSHQLATSSLISSALRSKYSFQVNFPYIPSSYSLSASISSHSSSVISLGRSLGSFGAVSIATHPSVVGVATVAVALGADTDTGAGAAAEGGSRCSRPRVNVPLWGFCLIPRILLMNP